MEILIALSVFAAVSAGMLALIQGVTANATATQARLAKVAGQSLMPEWQLSQAVALRANRMSSIGWVERTLSGLDFAKGLDLQIIRAGWQMRVSEFLATCGLTGGVLFMLGALLLGHLAIGALLAAFGIYIPYFLLRRAAKRRKAKIERQLVEMLVMMSSALQAGFSLLQAVDQAARQLPEPIAGELRQFMRDTQVGSSVEEAVIELGRRIGSYDLDIVVTAVLVQRNVGGNLSEILDNVAHTIRERDRIKGEIQTLIAEQKMTGMVISLIPVVIGVIFFLINRAYMTLLFTEPMGRVMLVGAVVLEVCGALMIRKIINIEV